MVYKLAHLDHCAEFGILSRYNSKLDYQLKYWMNIVSDIIFDFLTHENIYLDTKIMLLGEIF